MATVQVKYLMQRFIIKLPKNTQIFANYSLVFKLDVIIFSSVGVRTFAAYIRAVHALFPCAKNRRTERNDLSDNRWQEKMCAKVDSAALPLEKFEI